jgi:hypothetical protein
VKTQHSIYEAYNLSTSPVLGEKKIKGFGFPPLLENDTILYASVMYAET